jgi:hypothetical protein
MDTQKDIGFLRSRRTGWSAQNRHSPQTRHSAERGNTEKRGILRVTGERVYVAGSCDFAALQKTLESGGGGHCVVVDSIYCSVTLFRAAK